MLAAIHRTFKVGWLAAYFPTNRAKLVRAGVLALVQSLPRVRPGEKVVMDLAQTQDWASANLADVVVEQGITRHVFRS